MKDNKSNLLLYGLIVGGIVGAGLAIYFGSKVISKTNKNRRERKNKFYEGIDDIFDESAKFEERDEAQIDRETEKGIVNELFSRPN